MVGLIYLLIVVLMLVSMWNSYERSFIIEYQLYRKITVQKSY